MPAQCQRRRPPRRRHHPWSVTRPRAVLTNFSFALRFNVSACIAITPHHRGRVAGAVMKLDAWTAQFHHFEGAPVGTGENSSFGPSLLDWTSRLLLPKSYFNWLTPCICYFAVALWL